MKNNAILLLSGGLDSVVSLAFLKDTYSDILALTFNYGQKAFAQELKASKRICEKMGWSHEVIELDWLDKISNSSLNSDEDIIEVDVNDLDDLKKKQ